MNTNKLIISSFLFFLFHITIIAQSTLMNPSGDVLVNEGILRVSKPGSATGILSLSSPSGQPGIIFRSNEPETYRSDIKLFKTGLAFSTHANTSIPSIRMMILNDGKVGIGTTDPKHLFHLKSNGGMLNLEGSNHAYIQFYPDGISAGRKAFLGFGNATTEDLTIANQYSAGGLNFFTNRSTRMHIMENGNVGIGTTNPTEKLEIAGNGNIKLSHNNTFTRLNAYDGSGGNVAFFQIDPVPANDSTGSVVRFFRGVNSTANQSVSILRGNNTTAINHRFSSKEDSYLSAISGNVGVGTTSPVTKLHILGTTRTGISTTEYSEIGHGGSHGFINTVGDGNLEFRHDGVTKLAITSNGDIGIGTRTPTVKLHINDGHIRAGTSLTEYSEIGHGGAHGFINTVGDGNLEFRHDGSTKMKLDSNGKLIIGTTTTPGDYLLYVEKGILTEHLRAALKSSNRWADNAFGKKPDLKVLEQFIQDNSHLIGMPSAAELVKTGIDMVEMDANLLRQIEWLWEYTIEKDKERAALRSENKNLKSENKKQNDRIQSLEERLAKLEQAVKNK